MSFRLAASGISVSHGSTTVLDRVGLAVVPGSRIGIVGPNGVGKSTLLQVLAGLITPDAGSIHADPPALTIGYLPQEPDSRLGETLRSSLARRTGVAAAEAAFEAAAADLGAGTEGADDRYQAALDRYLALGGPDLDSRAAEVADDLGLGAGHLDQAMATLSGGEAARASLAAILLARFDVFLLDEPTNDLDFAGLDQLERFVVSAPGGVVVVSHDRAFLERTIDRVVELDEHTRTATEFGGGWAGYLDARAVGRRHAEEAFDSYQQQRQALEQRAQMQRQWATIGARKAKTKATDNDKFVKHFRVTSSEKQAAKAKQTARAMARLTPVDKPWEGWDLRMTIGGSGRSGDVVARFTGAVVERGDFQLGPVDLEVGWAERVAILGPNGSGKTTLLGALLGRVPLVAGERWLGPSVVVGELDQARGRFLGGDSLLDAFVSASGMLPREVRSLLAKFGLTAEHVARPTGSLSSGERTRAVLALLMAGGANLLVLDEPTNHLDLPAIEQLEQALDRFGGTVLLVTHDRRLLESVRITRTIELAE